MSTTTTTSWTLTLTEAQLTRERVAKINKRLTRRGYTGLVELTVGEPYTVSDTLDGGIEVETVVVDVTLTGRPAQYEGWVFVAAVDTLPATSGDAAFVLRCAPGMEATDAERASLAAYACQHCNTTRTNRTHSYLLRNASTGESIQVGKSCMADFLGCPVVPSMLPTTESLEDSLSDARGEGPDEFTPATVVATALAITDVTGYVSLDTATAHNLFATSTLVKDALYGNAMQRAALLEEFPALATPDVARANTMISALLAAEATSPYMANVHAALDAQAIGYRHVGIAASAVVAHAKMLETAQDVEERARAKAEREAANAAITYLGTEGEKVTVTGVVTRAQIVHSTYGSSRMFVIDCGAHVIKTFTTAKWSEDVDEKDTVTVTGTVKRHEEYEGVKQTVLTRCKATPAAATAA